MVAAKKKKPIKTGTSSGHITNLKQSIFRDFWYLCWRHNYSIKQGRWAWLGQSVVYPGSTITNGRKPKSCLDQVFNSKLGHIAMLRNKCMAWHAAICRVENSAQGLSGQLKFVHGLSYLFCLWIILLIGITALSIMTLSIKTFSITTFSIMGLPA